ncbi:hypothetical protein [Qipengyuania sp.]|uniref:hypothetical protein n=1 Tax=Qipengyuania sp. TaxID=2004515 RepID=UPI0035C7C4E3
MENARPSERRRNEKAKRALDADGLRELALSYVARYATSSGRLRRYCQRKLRERGHIGEEEGAAPPDVESLVADFVSRGFVDDAGFAQMRQDGLLRRGYGSRRVEATLRGDGISDDLRTAIEPGVANMREAAVAYARRRRFGPFARDTAIVDEPRRQKHLSAMMRAGHSHGDAIFVLKARDAETLVSWVEEALEDE